jgi:hypothetical protein
MKTWEQRLEEQVRRGYDNYKVIMLDLSVLRDNEPVTFAGDLFYVKAVSSDNATALVRINKTKNDTLELKLHTKIDTVFTKLFLTNTAQAGEWIELIVGCDFGIKNILDRRPEAQATLIVTHVNANTNVAAAAHVCRAVLLKSSTKNTATTWVDIGTAAVQGSCIPLEPGDSLSIDLTNTDKINANFEVGGEKLFVVYEV